MCWISVCAYSDVTDLCKQVSSTLNAPRQKKKPWRTVLSGLESMLGYMESGDVTGGVNVVI